MTPIVFLTKLTVIEKMTKNENAKNQHKKIALEYLNVSNAQHTNPVSSELIEKVYNLFALDGSEGQSFQKSLEKLIKDSEN